MGRTSVTLGMVLVAIAAMAAGAAASSDSDSVHARVRPTAGSAQTRFRVSFTAPESSGLSGSTWRSYEISAAGPSGQGCESTGSAPVGQVHAGERVHVTLAPDGSSHEWCAGTFAGRIEETMTPACSVRELCPAYVTVVTVGRFTFRVQG